MQSKGLFFVKECTITNIYQLGEILLLIMAKRGYYVQLEYFITSLDTWCLLKTMWTSWKYVWPWVRVTTHEYQTCTLCCYLGWWKHTFCWNFSRPEQRKSHILLWMASSQMVVFHHNELLTLITNFGGLLQLWYAKKVDRQSLMTSLQEKLFHNLSMW